jgi:heptosyltransferase-1
MKILVVKLSSLGDVLHLFPAISDLRGKFPQAEIHWLIEPAFAELAGWHSAVSKVIPVALRAHKKTWWKLPALLMALRARLRAEKYDWVLDAQGLLKSALMAKLAGAPIYGFQADSAREPVAARFYQKAATIPKGLHVIEKNRQLVAQALNAGLTEKLDFGLDKFYQQLVKTELPVILAEIIKRPYVVLLHGTTWNSKFWPEAAWAELIKLLAQQGKHCILPWGNDAELQRAKRLQIAGGDHARVLPKLSLTELMSVLMKAEAFVSVESGIGHLAAALDMPGVMLHGPTSPAYSGILGKRCQHLAADVECSPCFRRDCPLLNGQNVPPCQGVITPEKVLSRLTSIGTTPSQSSRIVQVSGME